MSNTTVSSEPVSVSSETGPNPEGDKKPGLQVADPAPITGTKKKGQRPSSAKKKGGRPSGKESNSKPGKSEPNATSNFQEGERCLQDVGLSLSGRKEHVLSSLRLDQYFQVVDQSWYTLVTKAQSAIAQFTLEEWRHVHALLLAARVERVQFEALGVKPSAACRSPVPKEVRIFMPLWSILASIGIVEDEELGVMYIPQTSLPSSEQQNEIHDLLDIVSCIQHVWNTTWDEADTARDQRAARYNYNDTPTNDTDFRKDRSTLITQLIALQLKQQHSTQIHSDLDHLPEGYTNTDGEIKDSEGVVIPTPDKVQEEVAGLKKDVHKNKARMEAFRLNSHHHVRVYSVTDGHQVTDSGMYGAFLHWDARLWADYSNVCQVLSGYALFTEAMPVETTGNYAWLLPTEEKSNCYHARLPRTGIPPPVWQLSLLVGMSTLPQSRRSTWYTESDRVRDPLELRSTYILAGIKVPPSTRAYMA